MNILANSCVLVYNVVSLGLEAIVVTYCTHCGSPTSKRICIHCGIKRNVTHNYCEWCGSFLDEKAAVCPECQERSKTGFGSLVLLFLEIIALVVYAFSVAMALFVDFAFVSAILFVSGFVIALPVIRQRIRKRTIKKHVKRVLLNVARVFLLIGLWFVATLSIPSSSISAVIVDNYGNTLHKAAVNLRVENNENSASFDLQYVGANITVDGTVSSVDHDTIRLASNGEVYWVDVYYVYLEEEWKITVISDKHPEVIGLRTGDKVQISSQIEKATSDYISLSCYRMKNSSTIVDFTTIKNLE